MAIQTLESVQTRINSTFYSYAYMDANGLQGNLTRTEFMHINNADIKRNHVSSNRRLRILYLLFNDKVIGAVVSEKPGHVMAGEEYDVYISDVDIDEGHRGQGLCKLMVQLFLLSANASAGRTLSFYLNNIGGQIACKCYANAFTECGYTTFLYETIFPEDEESNPPQVYKSRMNVSDCREMDNDENDNLIIHMGFMYNRSRARGGKRRKTCKNNARS